jgi:hypothetical protein
MMMMRRQSVGMMMAAAFQAFGVMSKVSPHKAHMDLWGELRRLQAIVDGRPRPRAHSFTGFDCGAAQFLLFSLRDARMKTIMAILDGIKSAVAIALYAAWVGIVEHLLPALDRMRKKSKG